MSLMEISDTTKSQKITASNSLEVSIILLCGLPGSGKSTISSRIIHHFSQDKPIFFEKRHDINAQNANVKNNCSPKVTESCFFRRVVHIDYDAITSSLANNEKVSTAELDNSCGDGASTILEHKLEGRSDKSAFTEKDLGAWRLTRKMALKILHDELSSSLQKSSYSSMSKKKEKLLILMDDNFHLRSMRRDVYKVCQEFLSNEVADQTKLKGSIPEISDLIQIGLTIVHMNTPLSTCLLLNERRRGTTRYIPKNVIIKMSQTLEHPDHEKARFESSTITVAALILKPKNSINGDLLIGDKISKQNLRTKDSEPVDLQRFFCDETNEYVDHPTFIKSLENCLQHAMDHQIEPSQQDKTIEQLEEERKQTLLSLAHREDRLLRRLVGVTCRFNPSLARVSNMARKSLLKEGNNRRNTSVFDDAYTKEGEGDGDEWVLQRFLALVIGKDCSSSNDMHLLAEKIKEAYKDFLLQNKSI